MVLPFTRFSGGNTDVRYCYSSNAGLTWNGPFDIAATSSNEMFPSASIYQNSGAPWYRLAYKRGSDSILYAGTGDIAALGTAAKTKVNNFVPTGWFRPEVGGHGTGVNSNGHLVYGGSGPMNLYYDGWELTGVDDNIRNAPSEFALLQNFPNPFNPVTEIRYSIPHSGVVSLKVYNLLGQEVATLVDGDQAAGTYTARFDGSAFGSGVYFYRLQAGAFMSARKMLYLK